MLNQPLQEESLIISVNSFFIKQKYKKYLQINPFIYKLGFRRSFLGFLNLSRRKKVNER